jgi:N-acetylmuramate 1-kinase
MSYTMEEIAHYIEKEVRRLAGSGVITVLKIGGDASNRIYHRCTIAGQSYIVMELGSNPKASEEASAGGVPEELPFLNVQRYLAAGGLSVPTVYGYLEKEGLLLLEDLGDETLESRVLRASSAERRSLYLLAIAELLRFQSYTARSSTESVCFRRCFDEALLRWELDHFRQWLLEEGRARVLNTQEQEVLRVNFDRIAQELSQLPRGWVHRDFQSRNIMVQTDKSGRVRLRVIDFQDALLGPQPYDVVALLRDSYVDLGLPLVEELLEAYMEQADLSLSKEAFRRAFWLQTVQRKLKDAGRFVYIDRVKRNPSFLPHIPNSLGYVAEALRRLPEYGELERVLVRHLEEFRSRVDTALDPR